MTTVIIDVASMATALPHSERSQRSHAANSHAVSALTPPVSSASAARAMIGAVLASVLDSGLDTPFGCVEVLPFCTGDACCLGLLPVLFPASAVTLTVNDAVWPS